LAALLICFGFYRAGADSVTAGTPRILTGTFDGFSIDGGALAFQQDGSATGTSFAWSASTMWSDSIGSIHSGGDPVGCASPRFIGHKMTIGIVETKPAGGVPGTWLVAFVKC
jgi:hypothetical protein